MSKKIKVICVVGPTASGKTGLGIEIARKVGGEIICADSMQIYKNMSIASAAPTKEERAKAPHHLAEFLDYGQSFTVADYVKAAKEKIEEIAGRGKTPIIVGGTGLYISSLADNISFTETGTDIDLRNRLNREMEEIGAEEMLKKLSIIDPEAAKRLHPNNRRRIIRAFEIYESAGITLSEQNRLSKMNESPYDFIIIGINYRDRQALYNRINSRVDKMLEAGILNEAKAAFKNQSGRTDGAIQAIGHKEFFPYFKGESTVEECTEKLKQSTRRYAKRQITWFSRDERINWIYPDETEKITEKALEIIQGKE
ncbi:MAG: tRNA (adenosine(37)-N6)-dimethylallyltransferase MiaA [Clostridia bacterium]|nr:tRNA (adenosine(37)-N6)-dimethylallyltransferase MiaA [Clostridia bacterium]